MDRINIFGNTVTAESVIRNQLMLDEGDPFSEILLNKSINNIKSLNFFKTVKSKVENNDSNISSDTWVGPGINNFGKLDIFPLIY